MEEKKNFEAIFKEDLYQYLLGIDKVAFAISVCTGPEVRTRRTQKSPHSIQTVRAF